MGKLVVGPRLPISLCPINTTRKLRSENFRGAPVVVYFYPKADTPGCTTQSCALRDAEPDLAVLGAAQ